MVQRELEEPLKLQPKPNGLTGWVGEGALLGGENKRLWCHGNQESISGRELSVSERLSEGRCLPDL